MPQSPEESGPRPAIARVERGPSFCRWPRRPTSPYQLVLWLVDAEADAELLWLAVAAPPPIAAAVVPETDIAAAEAGGAEAMAALNPQALPKPKPYVLTLPLLLVLVLTLAPWLLLWPPWPIANAGPVRATTAMVVRRMRFMFIPHNFLTDSAVADPATRTDASPPG